MGKKKAKKKVENIPWENSDKSVSPWGGMRLMKELLDRTGLRSFLGTLPLPQPGSNRGYDPVDVVESCLGSLWIGANKFIQTTIVRYDEVPDKSFSGSVFPRRGRTADSSRNSVGSGTRKCLNHCRNGFSAR
jgi:hypothetical protein